MGQEWLIYRVGQGIVIHDGKLLLVANRWYPDQPPVWSLPGGRAHDGESVVDAMRRELLEETGLEVTPGPLAYVAEARSTTLKRLYLACAFRVDEFREAHTPGEDATIQKVEWVPMSELATYLKSPSLGKPLMEYLNTGTVRYWYFPEYWEEYLVSLGKQ